MTQNPPPHRGEPSENDAVLDVRDLSVTFETPQSSVHAVNGVDFRVAENETLGVVGESGSGKSVTALSLLGLLEDTASVSGRALFRGEDVLSMTDKEIEAVRGNNISMVFQDPGSALNPVLKVGDQVSETIRSHQAPEGEHVTWRERSVVGNLLRSKNSFKSFKQSWEKTVELFERVGIPLPERRALEYPHEFSGGMKQRALIAMAISCQPDVLVADEPTTALDVTIEAQILELIEEVQREFGTAVVFITHDMGVIRKVCDRVAVMYAGHIVERAPTEELFEHPKHPYTESLLRSVPRLEGSTDLDPLAGSVPQLTSPPDGCPFAQRCPEESEACHEGFPPAHAVSPDSQPFPVEARDAGRESATAVDDELAANAGEPTDDDGEPANASDHLVNCVLYEKAAPTAGQTEDDR